jgi:hypothetical protein
MDETQIISFLEQHFPAAAEALLKEIADGSKQLQEEEEVLEGGEAEDGPSERASVGDDLPADHRAKSASATVARCALGARVISF